MPDALPPFTFLGDQPYSDQQDPLGFAELADTLARRIVDSRHATPFTVGIEGTWGMGKSTLMARLEESLARIARERETVQVTSVWFDAWTADEHGVLEGLVKTVLDEMDPKVLRDALRNERLMSWLRALVSVAASWLKLSSVVDQVWDRVAVDPRGRNQLRDLVKKGVDDWRERRADDRDDALLCVFVDDLDRCSPGGVLQVFEAMKLYMNVPGFVFVVGYDRDIVSDAVHRTKGYGEALKAHDYLEKIIQITYRIPRSGGKQSDALIQECLDSSGTAALFGDAERALVAERNERNPRKIKRFINSFVLTYGLDPRWRQFTPQSLIRVQLIYLYFKAFYDLLDRPSERDPATEFVEYFRARDVLRRRTGDWSAVRKAFEQHDLESPGDMASVDHAGLLTQLEANVPEPFIKLAVQDGFASLVESLAGAEEWPALRRRLAEGEAPPISGDAATAVSLETVEPIPEGMLAGMSVLWVDDVPENNRPYMELLNAGGATVLTANDTDQARALLENDSVDLLISDIGRRGRPDAGLEDLAAWQAADLAPDAAIFFTSRVTRARREAASALRAEITSDPRALLLHVSLAREVKDAAAREVLASLLDSEWEFRTAAGIAKKTRLPVDRVESILDAYPEFVRQSPIPDRSGAPLFAARSALQSRVPNAS